MNVLLACMSVPHACRAHRGQMLDALPRITVSCLSDLPTQTPKLCLPSPGLGPLWTSSKATSAWSVVYGCWAQSKYAVKICQVQRQCRDRELEMAETKPHHSWGPARWLSGGRDLSLRRHLGKVEGTPTSCPLTGMCM